MSAELALIRAPAAAAKELNRSQMRALHKVLCNAAQHVPFYREHWARAGVAVDRIAQLQLSDLPLVRKRDLLDRPSGSLLDRRCLDACRDSELTGGSTGQPFAMPLDRIGRLRRSWRFLRALTACGYRPGQRMLLISARRSSGARWHGWHYTDLSADESALSRTYEALRPHVLYGPLSTLRLLAEQRRSARDAYRLLAVISTAEEIKPHDRALLAEGFGVAPADLYGMTEFGLIAARPPGMPHYRIFHLDLLYEFLPTSCDSDLERLVVTDLRPGPLPLIRFDTGDLVRRDRSQPHAPIVGFTGREIDALHLPHGRKLSPYRVTLTLEKLRGLRQFQVTQLADLSIQVHLWCEDVPCEGALVALRTSLDSLFQRSLPIRIQAYAGALPHVPAGKWRPVLSLVDSTS